VKTNILHDEYVRGEEEIPFGVADQLACARRTVEKEPKSVDVHGKGLLLRVS